MKTGTLVEIIWKDHFDADDTTPEEIMNYPLLALKTAGYYIGENANYYFIARDIAIDGILRK